MLRKIILAALGVLLLIGAYMLFGVIAESKSKKRPSPAKVVKTVFVDTVVNTNVPIIIPANGSLVAKRRVALFAEVQGVFKRSSKLFKPGQKYTKGSTLIAIDNAEYYASVQSAKSNLYNTIASIMPDLRLDFPEVFPKWQSYLNSFDLNKSTPKLPEITSDKENYFVTGRGIVSSYYNVKNLEQRLAKYTIKAPFTGTLTEALVTEGSLVRNGQKLGEFIDTSVYELEVAIGKQYASLLRVGANVTLSNVENTTTYTGEISRVNASIDATTQTITAYIEVRHPDLKEGMYLNANLNAKQQPNAIEINRSLLLDSEEIFVVKDSILDVVPVKPVYFSDTKVVVQGVKNGEIILSKPVPGAYAGMLIKPITSNK